MTRVAVIGAGAAGLASTKALLDAGLDVVTYDSNLLGTWRVSAACVPALAALSTRVRRDLPTTRRGAVELFFARHLPSVTDRVVARTLAGRVRAGAFDNAELAAPLLRRHTGAP